MKRPLFVCGLAGCFAVIFCFYLPEWAAAALIALLALGGGGLLLFGRRHRLPRQAAAALLAAAVLAGYAFAVLQVMDSRAEALDAQTGEIEAAVTAVSFTEDSAVYEVKVTACSVEGAPQSFRARIYTDDRAMAKVGDGLYASVAFSALQRDSKRYYYPDGICLTGSVTDSCTVFEREEGRSVFAFLRSLPEKIRTHVREMYASTLSYDTAALLTGITLGDTSGFSKEMANSLSLAGVSHVVAVSGLHLSVVCGGLLTLLTRLRVSVRRRSVITLIAAALMAAVAGFTPSICRAAITYTILLAAQMLFVKSDALNSLGAASLILLLFNPLSAVSLSFQLSFAATLGILLFAPGLYRRLDRFLPRTPLLRRGFSYLSYGLCASLGSMLCTLPILVLSFGNVSLIAPVSNMFVVFPASAALVCGVLAALLSAVPFLRFLGFPFLFAAGLLARFVLNITRLLGGLPLASISFYEPYMKLCFAAVLLMLAAALIIGGKGRRTLRIGALCCVLLILSSALVVRVRFAGEVSLAVLDIQQGVCAVLTAEGKSAVIGCGKGGAAAAARYLEDRGIRTADLLLLPENNDTYAAEAASFVRQTGSRQLLAGADGKHGRALSAFRSPAALPVDGAGAAFGDLRMEVLPTSAGNCVAVFCKGKYILFAAPGANLLELETTYASPDFLVCGTNLPSGVDSEKPPVMILSGGGSDGYLAASAAGCPLYLTGGEGNLVFTFENNGAFRVRREG